MKDSRRLLALAVYPEQSAATRFRLIQMFPYLRARGWEVQFEPFLQDEFFGDFYSRGHRWRKGAYLASRSLSRLALAVKATDVAAVYVQREAALIGPAYVEAILGAVRGLPIIFDFDDAIWHLDLNQSKHPLAAGILKSPSKCWRTMRRARLVVAGSRYLAQRAAEVNTNVQVVPTVVSATEWAPLPGRLDGQLHVSDRPRIGWVGSHSTAHQLRLVEPALARLRSEGHRFDLHVVGAARDFSLSAVEAETRPWRLDEERLEFQRLDIGLAPMHDDEVYQGKCGFKQLQYMAVGVPCVSSWVGGAKDFVIDGENGLVARTSDDWYRSLKSLLRSRELRRRLARNGRKLVETEYSVEHQGPRLARHVDQTLRPRHTD